MGVGAFLEPLVVISLLAGGTIINREIGSFAGQTTSWNSPRESSPAPVSRSNGSKLLGGDDDDIELGDHNNNSSSSSSSSSSNSRRSNSSGRHSRSNEPAPTRDLAGLGSWSWSGNNDSTSTLLESDDDVPALDSSGRWRHRTLRFLRWRKVVTSPNTEVFKDRLLSRLLRRLPFLVEAWYWALIYWVYQLGRAFTALLIIDESVVDAARRHALHLVHVEQRLHLFFEVPFQQYFLAKPLLMHWINRIYSFIHIPGTILFLVVLYYATTTRPLRQVQKAQAAGVSPRQWRTSSALNPALYETRRRTMAMCNLIAFIFFTAWPCMPPRLLSDPNQGDSAEVKEAMSYGFVDTVHGAGGESSVWTTNRFCNQYAAMPSLHFGYSFLVGLTIATIPAESIGRYTWRRFFVVLASMIYPATILTAIIATANHFVLDAIAGACVCLLAWYSNDVLLNLLFIEDYFLFALRLHKPSKSTTSRQKYMSLQI